MSQTTTTATITYDRAAVRTARARLKNVPSTYAFPELYPVLDQLIAAEQPELVVPADPIAVAFDTQTNVPGVSITDGDDTVTRLVLSTAHGTLAVLTNVSNGIVAGDVTANGSASVTIVASKSKINTTLAATGGLKFTPTTDSSGAKAAAIVLDGLDDPYTEEREATVAFTVAAS
jgi:hypothetical protein